MIDLKKININVFGNFMQDDTIQIDVNGTSNEYTPDEVLGVIAKLAELQQTLTNNLVMNRMKEIDGEA